MAHVGQELALRLACRVGLVAGNRQLAAALLRFGFPGRELAGPVLDHALENHGTLLEFLAIANDERGDQGEGRRKDDDDQNVEQEDLPLIRRDNAVDLAGDRRRQSQDFAEYGVELLVEITADDAGGIARLPASRQDLIEFIDTLAQQVEVVAGFGQCRHVPERGITPVNRRADQ